VLPDGDLPAYVRAAKAAGIADDFIVQLLKNAGWSERSIFDAFTAFYRESAGLTIPPSGSVRAVRGSRIEYARDAFLYLLVFLTLAWWTISLGYVFFTLIDRYIPDPSIVQAYTSWSVRSISFPLAGIVVAFPLFLAVSWYQLKESFERPELLESGVRKWLTYIALVITALIVIGDVVTFIAWFLNGGLSSRFMWRVLVVFVLASGVFAYYLTSLRSAAAPRRLQIAFSAAAIALVAAGLWGGFGLSGPPSAQRARAEDDRRLSDLSRIQFALHEQWVKAEPKRSSVLPATLAEALPMNRTARDQRDPVTGAPYEFHALGGTRYQLCATFAASTQDSEQTPPSPQAVWQHPAGRYCFAFDALEEPSPFFAPVEVR
jgi:hypothetical protein